MNLILNGRRVVNAKISGVDFMDYPDFTDAYFSYAEFEDGIRLNSDALEALTEENAEYIQQECALMMWDEAERQRELADFE